MVKNIADNILILLCIDLKDGWRSFRKLCSNPLGFIAVLNQYDLKNVNPQLLEAIRPSIDSMTIDEAKSKSAAAAGLLEWLKIFVETSDILFKYTDQPADLHKYCVKPLQQPIKESDKVPIIPELPLLKKNSDSMTESPSRI